MLDTGLLLTPEKRALYLMLPLDTPPGTKIIPRVSTQIRCADLWHDRRYVNRAFQDQVVEVVRVYVDDSHPLISNLWERELVVIKTHGGNEQTYHNVLLELVEAPLTVMY